MAIDPKQTIDSPYQGHKANSHHLPSEQSVALGTWIHNHKGLTNHNFFGYNIYQYLRSAAASAPYGLSMAGTWLAFEKAANFGESVSGLPLKAIAESEEKLGLLKNMSFKQRGAFRLSQFAASPLVRTGAMIGTSFSLYRATSKIGKWTNEYLFNPEDSLETTIDKVEHLPEMIQAKAKEVYLPEFHSTLISAFVLGALVVYAKKATDTPFVTEAAKKTEELLGGKYSFKMEGWKHFWKEEIANPKANFVPLAAINALAYSLFFELGDRRFKDKQMSRGMWAGASHAIGSSNKSNPSLLQEPFPDTFYEAQNSNAPIEETTVPSYRNTKVGELPEGSRMGDNLSILTSEPSFLRFLGRRFVPTAAGIGIYSAIKMRGAYRFFGKFPDPEQMKSFGGFMGQAWREGAATSLFFVVPAITDKYAPQFDKFVNNLEAKSSGRTYDEVVAGYQPKRNGNGHATKLAAVDNDNAPNAKIAQPVEHQQTVAQEETKELSA